MLLGAAYYPEHWGSERLKIDVKLMKEAGLNVVRMAEFAWVTMQKEEDGKINFAWLDEAIETLGKAGIKTILCTPTATPPKWLMDKYPETYVTDKQGIRLNYGSRRHYCVNSENFLRVALKFIKEYAEHYKDNPYIAGWQIDNELGGDNDYCYCDNCKKAFRAWLKKRYGTIENLNKEWGTDFWSHTYNTFEEIDPPMYTQGVIDPSLALDYKRFHSDDLTLFQNKQSAVLRAVNPSWKITTNIFGTVVDNYKINLENDFVSVDFYPGMDLVDMKPYMHAMFCDQCRGYKNLPFVRMETMSGTPGGDIMFNTPRPNDLGRWAMEAVARGSDGIVFFRWRTTSSGAEEYWHGILNHDGVPRRTYREVQAFGKDVFKIAPMLNKLNENEVAIVYDTEILWAFESQPLIIDYYYNDHVKKYYQAMFDLNIGVDMIHPEQDFSKYKAIILPNFLFCTDELKAKIDAFVKDGGKVVMDYRSGVKTPANRVIEQPLPTGYADVLGIEIAEYGMIFGQNYGIKKVKEEVFVKGFANGGADGWFDVVEPKTAKVLATFDTKEYYNGMPAITENDFGKGKGYYIATELDAKAMKEFFGKILGEHVLMETPDGIEAVKRDELIFLISHNDGLTEWELDKEYYDVLNEKLVRKISLSRGQYAVIKNK